MDSMQGWVFVQYDDGTSTVRCDVVLHGGRRDRLYPYSLIRSRLRLGFVDS